MQTALSPIIMHNGHDRIMVRKTLNQKPCEDSKDSERDARMIALWCDTIDAAYEQAPRFKLRAGQTLIVDNYRLMHGRDPTRIYSACCGGSGFGPQTPWAYLIYR